MSKSWTPEETAMYLARVRSVVPADAEVRHWSGETIVVTQAATEKWPGGSVSLHLGKRTWTLGATIFPDVAALDRARPRGARWIEKLTEAGWAALVAPTAWDTEPSVGRALWEAAQPKVSR